MTPSRRIVIDADIAQAASDTPAPAGIGKLTRDFLTGVLEICHRAVFTPELDAEWKLHAGRFARKWRVRMAARRKLFRVDAPGLHGLEARVRLANPAVNPDEICKDLHLVNAALATDSLIASCDETFRRRLANTAKSHPILRRIVWVNPSNSEEQPASWLQAGAPADLNRSLEHSPNVG